MGSYLNQNTDKKAIMAQNKEEPHNSIVQNSDYGDVTDRRAIGSTYKTTTGTFRRTGVLNKTMA